MKILVTGFDPFGGETVNPAYEAVKLLPNTIAGAQMEGVSIEEAKERLKEVICQMMEEGEVS